MSDPVDFCEERETFLEPKYDITRIFDYLQAQVPSLTTDMASITVWAAVEDFYIRSTYRREHVYWKLNPGETVLKFDPYDRDWRVCKFMGFRGLWNVKFIPPGEVRDLTCPCPDNERTGEALLALKPNSINTKLPYDVMTTYWEAICAGAMSKLYMQPGKPYSNPQGAALHARMFRAGIAAARADAQAHHLREAASWSFPYFATGGRADGRQGL